MKDGLINFYLCSLLTCSSDNSQDPDVPFGVNSVGVVINPVKVRSLEEFGTREKVADRLLSAEREKESTLNVEIDRSYSRTLSSGSVLYTFEYRFVDWCSIMIKLDREARSSRKA